MWHGFRTLPPLPLAPPPPVGGGEPAGAACPADVAGGVPDWAEGGGDQTVPAAADLRQREGLLGGEVGRDAVPRCTGAYDVMSCCLPWRVRDPQEARTELTLQIGIKHHDGEQETDRVMAPASPTSISSMASLKSTTCHWLGSDAATFGICTVFPRVCRLLHVWCGSSYFYSEQSVLIYIILLYTVYIWILLQYFLGSYIVHI